METTRLLISKAVKGRIQYNDGEFAEVQTVGIEGIEENLLLATIQIHRWDTQDALEQFQRKFQVGMWLEIFTTTEISILPREH